MTGQAKLNPEALPKGISEEKARALSKLGQLSLQRLIKEKQKKQQAKGQKLTEALKSEQSKLTKYLNKKDPKAKQGLLASLKKNSEKHPKKLMADSKFKYWSDRVASYMDAAVIEGNIDLRLVDRKVRHIYDKEACEGLNEYFQSTGQPMQTVRICEPNLGPIRQPEAPAGESPEPESEEGPEEEPSPIVITIEPNYAEVFSINDADAGFNGFMRVADSQTSILPTMGGFAQINNFFVDEIGNSEIEVKAYIEVLNGEMAAWVVGGSVSAETWLSLIVAKENGDESECSDSQTITEVTATAGLEAVEVDESLDASTFELSCTFTTGAAGTSYLIQDNMAATTAVWTPFASVSTSATVQLEKIEVTYLD